MEPAHPQLGIARQCALVGLARSSWYYTPRVESVESAEVMRLLDEKYTRTPFYGIRRMTAWLLMLVTALPCVWCACGCSAHTIHERAVRLRRKLPLQHRAPIVLRGGVLPIHALAPRWRGLRPRG